MLKSSDTRRRIILLGYIVRGPLGGLVWHHMQYLLGLHRMGHEVLFLEDSEDYPACYNPNTNELSTDPSYGLRFLRTVFGQYGMEGHWAYYDAHTGQWHGKPKREALEYCRTADLLLNLSAFNPLREWTAKIPIRALVDTDPAFTQIRHLTEPKAMQQAQEHTCFFTFGENFGKPGCSIPDDGLDWQSTRQAVVPDIWPITAGKRHANWTTVMQWDSYKIREYQGVQYGMKSASFDNYFELPMATMEGLELAIGSATAPKEKLLDNGWQITDPLEVTRTPWRYQKYIQQSKGEWSIAKQGYVASNSGWFSERSAAYLASGRPVLVQDTGFSQFLETGMGLCCFRSIEEALEQLKHIDKDYQSHCREARTVMERYFGATAVLNSLLERSR